MSDDGRFKPGNQLGRLPKVPAKQQLMEALAKCEKEHGMSLIEYAVSRAYQNPAIMIAILKKILPDLTLDEGVQEAARTFLVRAMAEQKPIDIEPVPDRSPELMVISEIK